MNKTKHKNNKVSFLGHKRAADSYAQLDFLESVTSCRDMSHTNINEPQKHYSMSKEHLAPCAGTTCSSPNTRHIIKKTEQDAIESV